MRRAIHFDMLQEMRRLNLLVPAFCGEPRQLKPMQLFALALSAGTTFAQLALVFEVASIRPATLNQAAVKATGGPPPAPPSRDPLRFTVRQATLRQLIATAYSVEPRLVVGDGWLDSAPFEVSAKRPEGSTEREIPLMLRSLLIERFQLRAHHETRQAAAYVFGVGKDGRKFALQPDGTLNSHNYDRSPETMRGDHTQPWTSFLSDYFQPRLEDPIVDQTGITGTVSASVVYILNLPRDEESRRDALRLNTLDNAARLGLKVEHRKMPIDFLVIDHAARTPTGN